MDDPQRKPGSRDRDPLVARINRAAEQGRIAPADRDIRLGNVAAARSMTELDLIGRELDQVDATAPAAPAAPTTAGQGSSGVELLEDVAGKAVDAARWTGRAIGIGVVVLMALTVLGLVGTAALRAARSSDASSPGTLLDPVPITPSDTAVDASDGPSPAAPGPGTPYSLTGPGIRAFLALYRQQFGTSDVVDLTMYGDYVVVDVPVTGKPRHQGWLYRAAGGFTEFGAITANFPGAQPVDLDRLAIAPLVRNLARAQATLNVEQPTAYVIVRHYAPADQAPRVDIHVSNTFGESGYLATTLDGAVVATYPFASQ